MCFFFFCFFKLSSLLHMHLCNYTTNLYPINSVTVEFGREGSFPLKSFPITIQPLFSLLQFFHVRFIVSFFLYQYWFIIFIFTYSYSFIFYFSFIRLFLFLYKFVYFISMGYPLLLSSL